MQNKLTSVVVLIVAIVWAINFMAPLVIKEYKPAPELNLAFMAIIGVLSAKGSKKNTEDKDGG